MADAAKATLSSIPLRVSKLELERLRKCQKHLFAAQRDVDRARLALNDAIAELLDAHNAPQTWIIEDDGTIRKPSPEERQRIAQGLPV